MTDIGKTNNYAFHRMPGHLLRRCQQISVGIFHDFCKDYKLTPLQYAVLAALHTAGPLDQVTLGGKVALDRTTTAHVINRLLNRNLVARKLSAKDRRFKIVSMTAKGRKQLAAVQPAVLASQKEILVPLTDEEAQQLVDLLEKVAVGNNAMSRAPQS